jgi:hypothetical protein
MTVLAAPVEETVFWFIVLGLVVFLVFGVIALTVALFSIMRSISTSLGHLREVTAAQGAQVDPSGRDADSPADPAPTDGERAAERPEEKNGERGGNAKQ